MRVPAADGGAAWTRGLIARIEKGAHAFAGSGVTYGSAADPGVRATSHDTG